MTKSSEYPLSITIHTAWEWEDGDGEKCAACDDARWLTQLRLQLIFRNVNYAQSIALCQSCGQHIKPMEVA